MALTKIDDRGLKTPIDLLDNEKIRLGTGNDMEIYHSGSANYIDAGTIATELISDDLRLRSKTGNETYINADVNGAVELYHDNTLRFLTNSIGAQCQGDFSIPLDNEELRIGAGNDFRVKHDGTNTIMSNNTGALYISGDDIRLTNAATDESYIKGVANGAVELFYNNDKRLSTWSDGVNIYGDEGEASILHLYADDGDDNPDKWRIIGEASGPELNFQSYNSGNWTNNLRLTGDQGVDLYYNNGVTFKTITNGASMGSGTHKLLWPNVNNASSRSFGFIGEDGAYGKFELNCSNGQDTTLDETCIRVYSDGGVELYHDDTKRFETTSYGAALVGSLRSWGHVYPNANNDVDLGTDALRWRNIYTNDLNLSNKGSSNDIDGTWGDWTIQEGESDLFLKNNRSGKKYKFNLTEVS